MQKSRSLAGSLAGCGSSARADVNVVKVINERAATTEVGAGEKLLFDRIDSDTSIFMPPENNMLECSLLGESSFHLFSGKSS
jgi:hypothetical protein